MRSIAIVGAGFAGLSAAFDLAGRGHSVTLFESALQVGGLAAGYRHPRWDWTLEHYYHHWFTSDQDLLRLAGDLGVMPQVITRRPVTAQFFRGRAHALDGALPVLRFPGIPFADRVRLGLAVAWLKATSGWEALENQTAEDWMRRWMGRAAYETIFQPLLAGKFGPAYHQVPMSWLWARIHSRTSKLMYFEGGFQAFADALLDGGLRRGLDLKLATPVTGIRPLDDGRLGLTADGVETAFDRVIWTGAPHQLAAVTPDLPRDYLGGLNALPFLGAIVAVLVLDRPFLDQVYWLSMDKREFPFLACVEHTHFMDRAHYGGDHLLYLGDYLPADHPSFGLSDEALLAQWTAALPRINPAFSPDWVKERFVSRAAYAQPVVDRGFSKRLPPLQTPLNGLFLATMGQVYPWDRGTNYAVEIGRRVARLAEG